MLHTQNAEALSVESTTAHIWSKVPGSQPANPETSLFDACGNSLAAAKLMIQVEDAFGEDALPPEEFYARPTFADILATELAHVG